MNKKNGFTLVELLAVIIIIGILLLIAIPSVSRYLAKGKNEYYNSLENDILLAGRDYLNDYRTLLPKEIGNVTVISLNELLGNKYIDPVQDDKGNNCDARVTVKKTSKNQYEYYSCLICDNYQSKGEYCNYTEDDNVTVETKNYKVEVEKESYIIEQGSSFELPLGKAYYLGELVSSNVVGSPKVIDTNKIGITTVTYSYQGAKKQIKVEVIDSVSPSIPQIILKYDNASGSIYKNGWYSANIYAEFKSTDYTKPNLNGSGISYYEISNNGTNWTKINGNSYINSTEGNITYFVRSVDKSGNVSQTNSYTTKIDKTQPTCTIEIDGTKGNDNWYSSDVNLKTTANQTPSGIATTTISQKTILNNTTGVNITGTVTSNAGKVGSCSTTVKVDNTVPSKPSIVASDSIASNNWHNSTFDLNLSGGTNISGNVYYYGITQNPTTKGTKINIKDDTSSTTYYVKICSNAGLCNNSSYIVKLDSVNPTVPIIEGGSNDWVTSPVTITLKQPSTARSGIKYYEYYKSATNVTPDNDVTVSGTTDNDVTVSENGTTYIYYRGVSNSERRSSWSTPQVVNLETCQSKVGKTWTYDYNTEEQTFNAVCTGIYKVESYGAGGGDLKHYSSVYYQYNLSQYVTNTVDKTISTGGTLVTSYTNLVANDKIKIATGTKGKGDTYSKDWGTRTIAWLNNFSNTDGISPRENDIANIKYAYGGTATTVKVNNTILSISGGGSGASTYSYLVAYKYDHGNGSNYGMTSWSNEVTSANQNYSAGNGTYGGKGYQNGADFYSGSSYINPEIAKNYNSSQSALEDIVINGTNGASWTGTNITYGANTNDGYVKITYISEQ